MNKKEMQEFLEKKGITIRKTEGDDFSAVFHICTEDRKKIEENKTEYEKETGLYIQPSDMYGCSVVIMENEEEDD